MALPATLAPPLLEIRGLRVEYRAQGRAVVAVDGIELSIDRGGSVGLLGESGSGKSTIAMALLRELPATAQVSGQIELQGRDLFSIPEKKMRETRGAQASIIFQDPVLVLHPLIQAGEQAAEVLRAHRNLKKSEAKARVLELFKEVGFEEPERIYRSFPHQLSGGQCQRVAIAQALICRPDLVIADEPTASLDAESALAIVKLLRRLKQEYSFALLLVSHDPTIVRALADRVAVMRDGRIVEQGATDEVLRRPRDQYTKLLVSLAGGALPESASLGGPLSAVRQL